MAAFSYPRRCNRTLAQTASRRKSSDSHRSRLIHDAAMGIVANSGRQPIHLPRAESRLAVSDAPTFPMNAVWRTIRGYFWWSYERGTLHYDIMVTLILIFVFFSPYWINFNDKPVEHNPHPTGVVVVPDQQGGFIYQIDSTAV